MIQNQQRIVIFNRFIVSKTPEMKKKCDNTKVKEARLRLSGKHTGRTQRKKILISFLQSEDTTSPNIK